MIKQNHEIEEAFNFAESLLSHISRIANKNCNPTVFVAAIDNNIKMLLGMNSSEIEEYSNYYNQRSNIVITVVKSEFRFNQISSYVEMDNSIKKHYIIHESCFDAAGHPMETFICLFKIFEEILKTDEEMTFAMSILYYASVSYIHLQNAIDKDDLNPSSVIENILYFLSKLGCPIMDFEQYYKDCKEEKDRCDDGFVKFIWAMLDNTSRNGAHSKSCKAVSEILKDSKYEYDFNHHMNILFITADSYSV